MARKTTRDIGAEALEGIREIKRGEVGRVVTFPPVAEPAGQRSLAQFMLRR